MGSSSGTRPLAEAERAELADWFDRLARAIERTDYAEARCLQDEAIVVFGANVPHLLRGVDEVQAEEWERVWPHVRRCSYDTDGMVGVISRDALVVIVGLTATFSGEGFDGVVVRASYALNRADPTAPWRAVNVHYSFPPRSR